MPQAAVEAPDKPGVLEGARMMPDCPYGDENTTLEEIEEMQR